MKLKGNVGSFGFYLFMTAVQISCFLGLFSHLPQGITAYSTVIALPFVIIISFLILFFSLKLLDNYGNDTSKSLQKNSKSTGAAYKLILGIFLLFAAVISVLRYTDFVSECVNKDVSPLILLFLTMCGVLYGSCKGLEAICGSNGIIFAVSVVFLSVLFFGLFQQISIDDGTFAGFLNTNVFSVMKSAVYLISGMFSLPLSVLLFEKSRGNNRRSAYAYLLIYFFTVVVFLVFVMLCLGVFSESESNPLFVLSKISGMSVIEENDGLFFSVRTVLIFLELSGYTIGFSSLFERSGSRKSSMFFCAAVFIISEVIYELLKLSADIFAYGIVFGLILISIAVSLIFKKSVSGGLK